MCSTDWQHTRLLYSTEIIFWVFQKYASSCFLVNIQNMYLGFNLQVKCLKHLFLQGPIFTRILDKLGCSELRESVNSTTSSLQKECIFTNSCTGSESDGSTQTVCAVLVGFPWHFISKILKVFLLGSISYFCITTFSTFLPRCSFVMPSTLSITESTNYLFKLHQTQTEIHQFCFVLHKFFSRYVKYTEAK